MAACALLVACARRPQPRDAGPSPTRDGAPAVDASAAVDAPPAARSGGVWCAPSVLGDAVSNALSSESLHAVYGAVATPTEDLTRAEMRWVRWSDQGLTSLSAHTVTGAYPGAPMALLRRGSGFTVVWFPALRAIDGGVEAHAIDAEATGFTGDERPATAAEAASAMWASTPAAPRRRSGIQDLAPLSSLGDEQVTVAVPHGQTVPAVMLGDIEITRGADLAGFEPAAGLGVSEGGRRWVAVTRGHCQQTRLEVFRVDGAAVTLRGRFLFGTEVGVRWIRIDARRHDAVVSWYQSLIPVRIDCIRGPGGATLADHGPRVALVTSEGATPPPVPDLPDAGTRDAAVERDAAVDVSAAAPASTPRSP